MSIEVPLDELRAQLDRFDAGYLATAGTDGPPHLVAFHPRLDGRGRLVFPAGGRASRNVSTRPRACFVCWPVAGTDGYSLVIDGDAVVEGDDLVVSPTWAVLHRPPPEI